MDHVILQTPPKEDPIFPDDPGSEQLGQLAWHQEPSVPACLPVSRPGHSEAQNQQALHSSLHLQSPSLQGRVPCSPEDGGAGDSCIFFKLSNSGLELGAGREAAEAAGATAGGVNVKGGLAAGGGSLAEVDASSEEERIF